MKSGRQQVNNVLNRIVRFVVSGFEFAVWLVSGVGLMMEEAVGQGATQALVEEQKQESDLDAFGGEAIGIAFPIALEQSMALELTEIVT